MNRLSRAIYYVPLRKINRHAHTFGIASTVHEHELSRSDGEPVLCMDSATSNTLSFTYSAERSARSSQ